LCGVYELNLVAARVWHQYWTLNWLHGKWMGACVR